MGFEGMGVWFWGLVLGFGVWALGFWVWGLGFGIRGLGIWGLRLRGLWLGSSEQVQSNEFRGSGVPADGTAS